MKYIGEAARKNAFQSNKNEGNVVLGISNWQTVSRRDELLIEEVTSIFLYFQIFSNN